MRSIRPRYGSVGRLHYQLVQLIRLELEIFMRTYVCVLMCIIFILGEYSFLLFLDAEMNA